MKNLTKDILKKLQSDLAVNALINNKEGISELKTHEEALVIASAFLHTKKNYVIVKPSLFQAQSLFNHLVNILEDDVQLFAVEESLQVESIATSPEILGSRIETIEKCLNSEKPFVLVTHLAGILRYLPNPKHFINNTLDIIVGSRWNLENIRKSLQIMGYRLVDRVEQPLTFSYRGDVIDVFSIQDEGPVRIEFFDDEIESIRYFDIDSQMTKHTISETKIIPATDLLWSEEEINEIKEKVEKRLVQELKGLKDENRDQLKETIRQDLEYIENHTYELYLYKYFPFLDTSYSILDYLNNPFIILSPYEQIESRKLSLAEEQVQYLRELYKEGKSLQRYDVFQELNDVISNKETYEIHNYIQTNNPILSSIRPLDFPSLSLDGQIKEIKNLSKRNKVIIEINGSNVKSLLDGLINNEIKYELLKDKVIDENGVYVWIHDGVEGFTFDKENIIWITERELFNVKIKLGRYTTKFQQAQVLRDYDDLAPGDYVVHSQYGIGRYLGIVTKERNKQHHDYLNIVYRGDDVLLVPLEQFKLVRKFIGSEGVTPKLSKLGTNEWNKTKEKLQKNVENIAERLLSLYVAREENIGFKFSKDSDLQREFEDSCEFELTNDQAKAVAEVKKDMESKKPMDRLICGDVGFGKTEVAMRAAFKAILDKKQVAFLCPTTILSRQHSLTLHKRMAGFPVTIGLLNRFVEPSNQKRILKGVADGKVDILVGTHRLLSSDIHFKDLGLLIIDEEQRFGVEAKERIKELKQSVDVISLSATPIPRTLQMSLIGVRSLSQLNTPPKNRMPVQTYVIEKSENIMREVIERELSRDGQVYYLFNNVMRIYEEAEKIRQLVPESKVGIAHGKMDRETIEDVMMRFTQGEYNVLICTTIIENGIDISNANTMIVDSADRFGLSQLYQIKGRVGRSDRIAYAYLMINAKKQITELAAKRLESIKDFTQLGSGYKIAMRDLSIRGAGDLLGAKQAGFINTVGMDLYVEMLHDAIQRKKGIKESAKTEIISKSKIGVDGYIPQKFERKDYEKIHLYQRIDKANTEKQLKKLEEEVEDRYGGIANNVKLLFEKRRMDILANDDKVLEIRERDQEVQIVFTKEWCDQVDGVKLFEVVSKISLDLKMQYKNGSIILMLPKKNKWLELANTTLDAVNKLD